MLCNGAHTDAAPGEREAGEINAAMPALVFRTHPDATVTVSAEGLITGWNPAATRLLGYSEHEMVGAAARDLDADPAHDAIATLLARVAAEDIVQLDGTWRRRDGQPVEVALAAAPLRRADGGVAGLVISCRERRRPRPSVPQIRREFFDYSPDFVATADASGQLTYLNPAGRRMIGFPEDGDVGTLRFTDYVAPASLETFNTVAIPAACERGLWQGELQLVNIATGALVDVHRSIFAIRDDDGRLTGYGTVTRDITEWKRTEQERRQADVRYRVLHEGLRDPFVEVAMDGRIIDCNDLFCELLGYSHDELRSLTYQDLTPSQWHAFEDGIVRDQILPRGYSDLYEKDYRRKDGTLVPIELRTILTRGDNGEPLSMWAVVRDVSARKRHEAALRHSEAELADRVAELETLLTVSPLGIALSRDPACRSIWANPALRQLLRLDEGMDASPSGPDADRLPFRAMWNNERVDPDDLPMYRCCRTGQAVLGDEVELVFDDGSSRTLLVSAQPLFDHHHRVRGCIAFSIDITERRRAEDGRQLLVRELHHRVKNLFALLSSMVRLTARNAASVPALAEALDGRLTALARAHDCVRTAKATGADGAHTSLSELLSDLLAPHNLATCRLRFAGPAVVIGATAAPVLALAIHELATNAAKYGALSLPAGVVAITWHVMDDRLELRWSESGGPSLAGAPDAAGFGSKLVRLTIERQLRGTVTYQWLASGLVLTAAIPLASLGH